MGHYDSDYEYDEQQAAKEKKQELKASYRKISPLLKKVADEIEQVHYINGEAYNHLICKFNEFRSLINFYLDK